MPKPCPVLQHWALSAIDKSVLGRPILGLQRRAADVRPTYMHLAGQEPEIVEGAVMYLQLSAPALWFYVMAECLKRYLLAQVWSSLQSMPAWASPS